MVNKEDLGKVAKTLKIVLAYSNVSELFNKMRMKHLEYLENAPPLTMENIPIGTQIFEKKFVFDTSKKPKFDSNLESSYMALELSTGGGFQVTTKREDYNQFGIVGFQSQPFFRSPKDNSNEGEWLIDNIIVKGSPSITSITVKSKDLNKFASDSPWTFKDAYIEGETFGGNFTFDPNIDFLLDVFEIKEDELETLLLSLKTAISDITPSQEDLIKISKSIKTNKSIDKAYKIVGLVKNITDSFSYNEDEIQFVLKDLFGLTIN